MKKTEVYQVVRETISDNNVLVFCNGIVSREGYLYLNRSKNFYMLGSMGHASVIGMGIAQNIKDKIIVFDGDGNIFMNLGGPAMIGAEKVTNLIHIVFDNKFYETTGCQKTISEKLDIEKIGKALGYRQVKRVSSKQEFKVEFNKDYMDQEGPSMIVVDADRMREDPSRIIPMSPQEIAMTLQNSIKKE